MPATSFSHEPPTVSSFSIDKLAPRELRAGEAFEYVLRVTNRGTDALEGAVLVEALLSSITILECHPASQVSEDHMGRWSLGDIAPGEASEIRIRATSARDMPFTSFSSLSFATHA